MHGLKCETGLYGLKCETGLYGLKCETGLYGRRPDRSARVTICAGIIFKMRNTLFFHVSVPNIEQ